jgi:hypothetical protein
MKNFLEIPEEFIEHSLQQAVAVADGEIARYEGDLKQVYFAGATLFLDTCDEFGIEDIITVSHTSETFGYFSGDTRRRLLSIKAMKLLETIMKKSEINHTPKFL